MQGLAPGILTSGGRQYATWSTTNKSSNITLSNGNLTYEANATNFGVGVSTIGKSSGKWYLENTLTLKTNQNACFGLYFLPTLPNSGNTSQLGVLGSTIGWNGNGVTGRCATYSNIPRGTGCTAQATGQIIGIALDLSAMTVQFYVNGVLNLTISSLPAGTYYIASGADNTTAGNRVKATTNFGATPFVYPVPAGYNSGFYN